MRVAVLMGGTSDERDVSLSSGAEVADALREAGHEVVAVDTTHGLLSREEEAHLLSGGVDAAPPGASDLARLDERHTVALTRDPSLHDIEVFFLALHGGSGEDGTLQALLDAARVTYTGSDRLGCSLAMDKEVSKRLLRDAGVPTPDWMTGQPSEAEVVETLGLPVIVKASSGGSSLRLILAHDRAELVGAIEESRGWDDVVLFERYHSGRELTVAVLGAETLPVGEIIPEHEIFDYECKYQPDMAQEIFPADIPETLAKRLGELALTAHRALRMRDYSRVDFIVDEDGQPWCLEANALPGMTANSLLPKAARAAGIEFPELCDRIMLLAAARKRADRNLPTG
ncbi:MAG TPA: D-alanine--D-alanine ligase [Gemmatimonadetes bacterium]|nr:D-alanine--D-alanine ligase [Gemmatimonadota bacterium]HBD97308.1 D-alanine--D-alanine ligase [Gemmatimonadota bacterium]HIC55551.1 D-alanine--D-alanine ligase [Gemmatimonadota bacterium]HIN52456.1 D-alanine--D-alanine ligase [Gemmatimonadota bacterium]